MPTDIRLALKNMARKNTLAYFAAPSVTKKQRFHDMGTWRQPDGCLEIDDVIGNVRRMRLCHPPDGSTSPKYKLLCFITTKFFCKEKYALAFNRDRCCQLVLCLRLIPSH